MKSLTNSSVDQETQQTDTPETPGAPGASSVVEDPKGSVDDDSTPPGTVVSTLGTVDAGNSPSPGAEDPVDEATEGRIEETGGGEGSNATLGGAAAEAVGAALGSSGGTA